MLSAAWVTALTHTALRAEQAPTKSVWDGVYSVEQAEKGAAAYKASCAECHGADFMGDGFAPALAGADFQGNWNDLTVGDLFERIRVSMPPSGASSVTPEEKADIVAHILAGNKYPAGKGVLEAKTEALKAIKIELKK